MPTIEFTDVALFLAAQKATKRAPGKAGRPELPRAPAGQGDRLSQLRRLAARGFWPRYRSPLGFDTWHIDGRVTPLCDTYQEALAAAEETLRGG